MGKRFWEIDFSRGLAIILMIIFNYAFSLRYFNIYDAGGGWVFWWLFPRLIAGAFIFIAGLSLSISYARSKNYARHVKRGLFLLGIGLGITLVTYILFPKDFIIFGILHFIGAAIILSVPLLKSQRWVPFLAALSLMLGIYLQSVHTDFSWLVWLGLAPENFRTLDYFPVFPWFGIFLLGIFLGGVLYRDRKRAFKIKETNFFTARLFCLAGRHSLIIYLLHQPVLVIFLYMLGIPVL